MKKIIRTSTVAISLDFLLKGQLAFLNKHYEVIAVSGEDEHLKAVENREGVKIFNLAMQRPISPIKDIISLWKLYRLFKKEKPKIVHSITPKAGLLSMTAAYFARVPLRIHTFTGLIFPTKKGGMQRLLILMDKLLCNFATHIYPEGEGVKRDLIRYNITDKPLKIIANGNVNGIDIEYFSPHAISEKQKQEIRKQFDLKSDDFVFIFVGRLVTDKGVNELINAFIKCSNKNKSTKLLLVGPFEADLDPLTPETLAAIENNPNIKTAGFQMDVRPCFAISNALVFPSYREGFPNVVLQAGAMELPSIVSDINGCNEIIEEGKNGAIIPVKDSGALFKAMDRMFLDNEWRNGLKINAREMVVSRYEQSLVWEAILAEYKTLENNV